MNCFYRCIISHVCFINYSKSACNKATAVIQEILDKNGFNEEKKIVDTAAAAFKEAPVIVESAPVKPAAPVIDESKLSKSALRRKRRKERDAENGVCGDKEDSEDKADSPNASTPVDEITAVHTSTKEITAKPSPLVNIVTPTSVTLAVDIPALVGNAPSIAAADAAFFSNLMSSLPKFPDTTVVNTPPAGSIAPISQTVGKSSPVPTVAPPGFGLGLGSLAAPLQAPISAPGTFSYTPGPSVSGGLLEAPRLSLDPNRLFNQQPYPIGNNGTNFPSASNLWDNGSLLNAQFIPPNNSLLGSSSLNNFASGSVYQGMGMHNSIAPPSNLYFNQNSGLNNYSNAPLNNYLGVGAPGWNIQSLAPGPPGPPGLNAPPMPHHGAGINTNQSADYYSFQGLNDPSASMRYYTEDRNVKPIGRYQ